MSGPRARGAAASKVRLRRVTELDEIREAEGLQREVWGFTDIDIVPGRLMAVVCRNGGMLIGAFDAGRMVGFVFGYPGYRDGAALHCSHMLAVLPEFEGKRIGFRLKQAQRREMQRAGLDHILWTFDPLEGRNAHLNIRLLGVRVWEYWFNLYGATSSALHAGVETDRFVARWQLDDPDVEARSRGGVPGGVSFEEVMSAGDFGRLNRTRFQGGVARCVETTTRLRRPRLVFEIPYETGVMRRDHPRAAQRWQAAQREVFPTYFRRGYRVVDFVSGRDGEQPRSFYVLERST